MRRTSWSSSTRSTVAAWPGVDGRSSTTRGVSAGVMIAGNRIRNVVPLPTVEVTLMSPPLWVTIPCTIARPRPEPLPTSFVV